MNIAGFLIYYSEEYLIIYHLLSQNMLSRDIPSICMMPKSRKLTQCYPCHDLIAYTQQWDAYRQWDTRRGFVDIHGMRQAKLSKSKRWLYWDWEHWWETTRDNIDCIMLWKWTNLDHILYRYLYLIIKVNITESWELCVKLNKRIAKCQIFYWLFTNKRFWTL